MPNAWWLILLCFVCTASMGAAAAASKDPSHNPYHHLNNGTCYNATKPACPRSTTTTTEDNSTLAQGVPMRYGESLYSSRGLFKMELFVLGSHMYLGIRYNNISNDTKVNVAVWIANRDKPIPATQQNNCSLVVAQDGIGLLDSNNNSLWSLTSKKDTLGGIMLLQLFDNGNLMLVDRSTREIVWQSFEHPTDTILPDQRSYFNTSMKLSSWNPPDSPPAEEYSYTFQNVVATETTDYNFSITRNDSSAPYWASSVYFAELINSFLNAATNATTNATERLFLSPDGRIQLLELDKAVQGWSVRWIAPKDQCDLYQTCGSFGVCDAENGFKCKCLPGSKPRDPAGWESKDFNDEQCLKESHENCSSGHGDNTFYSLPMIYVRSPGSISSAQSDYSCKNQCNTTCGCNAYSFNQGTCRLWTEVFDNIQEEYYNPGNHTLSIRVATSDIDFGKHGCEICGTNVIPYPLSTNSTCGDPNYLSFQCNSSNGQVYFRSALNGSFYKVSHINPSAMRFVVQLPRSDKCDTANNIESRLFNLKNSSPFSVTNCSVVELIGRASVIEVEMSWEHPPPPACSTQADCMDWPNTTCYQHARVCRCSKGFRSSVHGDQFLYCTEVASKGMRSFWVKVGIASTSGIVLLLSGIAFCVLYIRIKRAAPRLGITEINKDNDIENIDIPFVDYESILYATDNFSDANKLGAGGFGPVYKGELADGNAIAVKRLSAASIQGIEEFRNEVILIAKLQHRNLVRVLGYCAMENEKILIYEYMPNRSLDAFLFDQTLSPLLDWTKRFSIITGIARGLLYLHQDSRLKIIHRDMKPSNILLDEELNPKISDFGLARIVAGNEMTTTSTVRIVGTHGYMSPEYALDGYFSIKSDVYSFGIVVLEIISGKRCAALLSFDNSLISLLGYAWYLWDAGNPLELVDKSVEPYDDCEVKRCINIGLLCVQEDPSDRPTMSSVLLMLGGDSMSLPFPKQPVFVSRKQASETTSSSSSKVGMSSNSNVGLTTIVEGR